MTTREGVEAAADGTEPADAVAIGRALGTGFAWSLLNNVTGRIGNFLTGVIVVRILSPGEYGTFAVGLVVLTVLLSMNDLGISAMVIQRRGSVDDIAPTVMTMSIVSSTVVASIGFLLAPVVAPWLNAPEAVGLIRMLLACVVIDGIVAVPNAMITRAFDQRKRLLIDSIAFFTGTPVIIGLALSGFGAYSLGWGTLIGNTTTGLLALLWTPRRFRPGWDRSVVPGVMRFGLPLAGAGLLLFLLLNVDYVIVGHALGSEQLGYYLLAFNLCSWPVTVISTAIRRVALAAFSRMNELDKKTRTDGFRRIFALVMAMTVPLYVMLGGLASSVIHFVYGHRWIAAAAPLAYLAVFSLTRVLVELVYDYLAAIGRTTPGMLLNATWLIVLVPTLLYASHYGITGVARGHALVSALVIVPLLAYLLHRAEVPLLALARSVSPVVFGAVCILGTLLVTDGLLHSYIARLFIGGLVATVTYIPTLLLMRRTALAVWRMAS